MMRNTIIRCGGAWLAACFFHAAQAADTAQWISLEEALGLAAASNERLAIARESAEQARLAVKASEAAYWPTLTGAAGYTRADSDTRTDGPSDQTTMGLTAQYALYSGFADSARVRQAEAALEQARADWASAGAAVLSDVRKAFVRLLYAQERAGLAETTAERRRQNLDLVQLRFESGSENRGSLLRTEATTRQAEAELEQARRSISVQQRELAGVLGREDRVAWVARGEWTQPEAVPEPAWNDLMRATPERRSAQARVEAQQAQVIIARGNIHPELGLRAGLDRSGEDWPPDNDAWSVGATLSIPLFTGGRNISQLAAARAGLRQAEASLRQTGQNVLLDLESAWAALRDAIQQRDVQAAFREAAEVRADIARAQYENGLLSFQNWDQIEDELIQSRQNLLARERDAALAAAEWDRVRGRSLVDVP
ncbi:MAG TPA: TolC family protein [Kiritimatiellia bacterium]|nr:TolC family protein [Kiritimatiellia bacterium]